MLSIQSNILAFLSVSSFIHSCLEVHPTLCSGNSFMILKLFISSLTISPSSFASHSHSVHFSPLFHRIYTSLSVKFDYLRNRSFIFIQMSPPQNTHIQALSLAPISSLQSHSVNNLIKYTIWTLIGIWMLCLQMNSKFSALNIRTKFQKSSAHFDTVHNSFQAPPTL